jgi:hypothetical protein
MKYTEEEIRRLYSPGKRKEIRDWVVWALFLAIFVIGGLVGVIITEALLG